MEHKKLPIGESNFKSLIEDNYYYVDKTLLIKELIDNGVRVTVLPRPRRFGKTLNLNMLKCFFEVKEEGEKNLFKDLAIWQSGKEYQKWYGKFPIVYFTFKDVKLNDWPRCERKIQRDIGWLYADHKKILSAPELTAEEKERFKQIMNGKAAEDLYPDSLKFLMRCLFMVYKSKVIVLIDEYDIPIQQGYTEKFYKEVVEFSKIFLSGGLKDNPHLEIAVLTGVLRVSKESIFSDLHNPEVCTLLSHQYADKFGLLEEEVQQLLNYFDIGFEMDHVRTWYHGYICGDKELYNPWSIINFANKPKDGFKPYWINSSSNALIKEIIKRSGEEVKNDLKILMENKSITRRVDENIVFPEIESDTNHLFSFLLFSGYLKPLKIMLKDDEISCELAIPNKEVKLLYKRIISSWFSETIEDDKMKLMLIALTSGDIDTFAEIFTYYLETSVSYFNLGADDAERVYQAFTLGLVIWLGKDYVVTSEEPAGYGRADLMLIPHDKTKRGVIFEFKKAGRVKNKTLKEAAEAAKKQMIDKNYFRRMEAHGVTTITQVAIGFKGNECLILEV